MEKRTIFISGAASGIGERTARYFIEKGFYVGLYDIDETKLEVIHEELGEENCCYKKCDITNENELEEAFSHFSIHSNARMDVLFANAGVMIESSFESTTSNDYKKLIEINDVGTINTIKKGLELLKSTPNSKIIISSTLEVKNNFSIYNASHAFLKSLSESLNKELKVYNVDVHTLMIDFVNTGMMDEVSSKYRAKLQPIDVAKKVYEIVLKGKKVHYLLK